MKAAIKSVLPEPVYKFLRNGRKKYLEYQYFNQGSTHIKCGDYKIEAPKNHLIVTLLKVQPYRDICIGITAKFVAEKYPGCTMIDIGANIGDTAALMATYAKKSKLILVEASDYFFDILKHNSSQFSNEVVLKKVLISDGSEVCGSFHHWAGTASFLENSGEDIHLKSEQLSSIADSNTRFIKTDTDGYDFKILTNSLNWLSKTHPAILFENQIRNEQDLADSDNLFERLINSGYSHFVVWDDPGFYLLSTDSLSVLTDLNRYLFKIFQQRGHRSISNYDVLCLHDKDKDILLKIIEWYKVN